MHFKKAYLTRLCDIAQDNVRHEIAKRSKNEKKKKKNNQKKLFICRVDNVHNSNDKRKARAFWTEFT